MAVKACKSCGRPLKAGVMFRGKVLQYLACKSPVCPKFGKRQ